MATSKYSNLTNNALEKTPSYMKNWTTDDVIRQFKHLYSNQKWIYCHSNIEKIENINSEAYGYKAIEVYLQLKEYTRSDNDSSKTFEKLNMRLGELNFLDLPEYLKNQKIEEIYQQFTVTKLPFKHEITGVMIVTKNYLISYDYPSQDNYDFDMDVIKSKGVPYRIELNNKPYIKVNIIKN